MKVEGKGAARWSPVLVPGEDELQLRYRCRQCGRVNVINLQPPPWHIPVGVDDDDFEERRAAGRVEHERTGTLATQLWCHACDIGCDVTIGGG